MRLLEKKLSTRSKLAGLIASLKQEGKSVVTTNGCFDILHWGHIQYLEKARLLGDVLICLVNSDASVTKLKGPTRPIHDELTRSRQLAALECVDWVAVFTEDTPEQVLSELKPSIHVKGGDYSPDKLPETAIVEKNGGKVICLPLAHGFSTTSILNK